jgi:hypothetical protein
MPFDILLRRLALGFRWRTATALRAANARENIAARDRCIHGAVLVLACLRFVRAGLIDDAFEL